MKLRTPLFAALVVSTLTLAGCQTSEQKAEGYYQSGLTYLKAGDVDRALVEFRNVFQYDGKHHDARMAYADAEFKRGNLREAYSQYLRLVEQYPDDLPALLALSNIAVDNGQWDEADRFTAAALKAKPDDVQFQSLKVFSDYGRALDKSDSAVILDAVGRAKAIVAAHPDDMRSRKVIIDDLIRAQALDSARKELDAAIAIAPDDRLLYAQRLSVYAGMKDDAAVEAGLKEIIARFPDATEMKDALTRWYLSRNDYDKAEANMRAMVDPASSDTAAEAALVRFLGQYRSPDAAIAELDKVIASGKAPAMFRSARAGYMYAKGEKDKAIAEMEGLVKTLPEGADLRTVKVGLAQMKAENGDMVGARALVEDVLAQDSGQPDAIRMKANWLIDADQTGDAIAILRDGINAHPKDAGLMTLLAQAYERQGDRDLMRDMMSQAVQASGRAPDESLRYARLLASEGKYLPAETVLLDSLRLNPGQAGLLVPLGQVYLALKDWPRADAVAKELEAVNDPAAAADLAALQGAILQGQKSPDAARAYLEQMAKSPDAKLDAKIAFLRSQLDAGQTDQAVAFARQMLTESPDDLNVQFLVASVEQSAGNAAAAEAGYRKVLAADSTKEAVWLALYQIVGANPVRTADASKILDDGLAALPASPQLLWARAGELEAAGKIDDALAIYEKLYADNSGNPIVANNLASLLSNYRKDPDSLKRAAMIARRLKGSDYAPYQDTYGWIAALNGQYDEAIGELEKAAKGLPDDPTVRYHLAMAYLGANRKPEAATAFAALLSKVPEGDSREFVVSARDELKKLADAGIAPQSP